MNSTEFFNNVNSYVENKNISAVTSFLDEDDVSDAFISDDIFIEEEPVVGEEDSFLFDDEDDFLSDDFEIKESIVNISDGNNSDVISDNGYQESGPTSVDERSFNIKSINIEITHSTDSSNIHDEFESWCDKEFVGDLIEEWADRFEYCETKDDIFKHWLLLKHGLEVKDSEGVKDLTVAQIQSISPSVLPLSNEMIQELLTNHEVLQTEECRISYQMLRLLNATSEEVLTLLATPNFINVFKKYRNTSVSIAGALVKICLSGEFEESQFDATAATQPGTVSEFINNYYSSGSIVLTRFSGESPDVMKSLLELYKEKGEEYDMPIKFKHHSALPEVINARRFHTECDVCEEFILNGAPAWFVEGYGNGVFNKLKPNASLYLSIANRDCEKFGITELKEVDNWIVENYYANNTPLSEYKQLLLFKSLGVILDEARGVPSLSIFLVDKFTKCVGISTAIPRTISRMIILLTEGRIKMIDAEEVLFNVDFVHKLFDSAKKYKAQLTNDASMLIIAEEGMFESITKLAHISCLTNSSIERWAESNDCLDPLHYNALKLMQESGVNLQSFIDKSLEQYNSVDRCFDYIRMKVPNITCMFESIGVAPTLKMIMPLISVKSKLRFVVGFVSKYFTDVVNNITNFKELDTEFALWSMYGVPATLIKLDEMFNLLQTLPRDIKCTINTIDSKVYFKVG